MTVTNVLGAPAVQITLDGVTTIEDNTTINGTLEVTQNATLPLVNGSAPLTAASSIDDLTDVDTTTAAPVDGQVLTWVDADSEWAPSTPAVLVPKRYVFGSLGTPIVNGGAQDTVLTDLGEFASGTISAESSDAFFSTTVDSNGGIVLPAGTWRIEACTGLQSSSAGSIRLRLRENGSNILNAGRAETTSGGGDSWCQTSWVVETNGTDSYDIFVDRFSGSVTLTGCSFIINEL